MKSPGVSVSPVRLVSVALAACGVASSAFAQTTIVQWGGDTGPSASVVSGAASLYNSTPTTKLIVEGTKNNPAYGTSGYFDSGVYGSFAAAKAAGYTPTFSIAYASVGSAGGLNVRLFNSISTLANNDGLLFNSTSVTGSTTTTALMLWESADFLSTTYNSLSSLAFTTGINSTTGVSSTSANLVIKLGGQYYVSSSAGQLYTTSGTGKNFSLDLATLKALSWASYDPASSIVLPGSITGSLTSFDNLEAVGLQMTATSTSATQIAFGYFEATGVTPVPESSAFAAVAGAGALALVAYRRRRASV